MGGSVFSGGGGGVPACSREGGRVPARYLSLLMRLILHIQRPVNCAAVDISQFLCFLFYLRRCTLHNNTSTAKLSSPPPTALSPPARHINSQHYHQHHQQHCHHQHDTSTANITINTTNSIVTTSTTHQQPTLPSTPPTALSPPARHINSQHYHQHHQQHCHHQHDNNGTNK